MLKSICERLQRERTCVGCPMNKGKKKCDKDRRIIHAKNKSRRRYRLRKSELTS